jgi:hypothetical protein
MTIFDVFDTIVDGIVPTVGDLVQNIFPTVGYQSFMLDFLTLSVGNDGCPCSPES